MLHYPMPTPPVIPLAVVMLAPQQRKNRHNRRRSTHGRQARWDKMAGKLSPKRAREAGL